MASLDLEVVRHALSTAREHAFAEVEISVEGASFRARFESGQPRRPSPSRAAADTPSSGATASETRSIKSPLVGFFHFGPVALEVGREIHAGDVVGIVNALGIANDLESTVSGEVVEVLVDDGQPVEFGQVVARVKG
ncbi:MAG TPA: biotin/lipoyl-containing protein [Fimbriimonadaceae bacterium]|nr:biotin/lipoyl-containing protein [Fimbriimonadaceae bacterium]